MGAGVARTMGHGLGWLFSHKGGANEREESPPKRRNTNDDKVDDHSEPAHSAGGAEDDSWRGEHYQRGGAQPKYHARGAGGKGKNKGGDVRKRDKSRERTNGGYRRGERTGGANGPSVHFEDDQDQHHNQYHDQDQSQYRQYYNREEQPRQPPRPNLANRIDQLERRLANCEKLSLEAANDAREAVTYTRMCFLGPSADPMVRTMTEAKEEYDHMDEKSRGSPQSYRCIAALSHLVEDSDGASTLADPTAAVQEFLAHMKESPTPAKWEQHITVFRTATTRDREIMKLHIQMTKEAEAEFHDLIKSIRLLLLPRGWQPKDATAPTSIAYKSVAKEVSKRRGWS
jgi:hypothetical protein